MDARDVLITIYLVGAVGSFVQSIGYQFTDPLDDDPAHIKVLVAFFLGVFWPARLFNSK